jgi:hypothetical protein
VTADRDLDRLLWAVGEARRLRRAEASGSGAAVVAPPWLGLGPEDFAGDRQATSRRERVADAPLRC